MRKLKMFISEYYAVITQEVKINNSRFVFKMSYSFANEDMPSRDNDIERDDLDFDLSQLDEIDNEIDNLGDNNKPQNGGKK